MFFSILTTWFRFYIWLEGQRRRKRAQTPYVCSFLFFRVGTHVILNKYPAIAFSLLTLLLWWLDVTTDDTDGQLMVVSFWNIIWFFLSTKYYYYTSILLLFIVSSSYHHYNDDVTTWDDDDDGNCLNVQYFDAQSLCVARCLSFVFVSLIFCKLFCLVLFSFKYFS